MGKVVIDYEKFKDILGDYLAKNLIDEIISCMNDNLVFIEAYNCIIEQTL